MDATKDPTKDDRNDRNIINKDVLGKLEECLYFNSSTFSLLDDFFGSLVHGELSLLMLNEGPLLLSTCRVDMAGGKYLSHLPLPYLLR